MSEPHFLSKAEEEILLAYDKLDRAIKLSLDLISRLHCPEEVVIDIPNATEFTSIGRLKLKSKFTVAVQISDETDDEENWIPINEARLAIKLEYLEHFGLFYSRVEKKVREITPVIDNAAERFLDTFGKVIE